MDIPVKTAKRILEYLDGPSIAAACIAIPYWKPALNVECFAKVLDESVRDMTWLDDGLCTTLLPQSEPNKFNNPSEALIYQVVTRRFPYNHPKIHSKSFRIPGVRFLTLVDDYYQDFMGDVPEAHPIGCLLPLLERCPYNIKRDPELPHLSMSFDLKKHYTEEHWKKIDEMLCIPEIVKQKRAEKIRSLRDFNVIIILIDLGQPIGSEVCTIAEALTSRQTLVFAVVRDLKSSDSDNSCNIDYLIKLYNTLGGSINPPLISTSAKWRLWCVSRKNLRYTNLEQLVQWEFMETCSNEVYT